MSGLLYTALGLIIGLLFACVSILGLTAFTSSVEDLAGLGGGSVIISLVYAVCMPILYGVIGFIAGAVMGVLYNIIAGVIGGVQLELVGGNLVKGP
jgi:hypothetical protein